MPDQTTNLTAEQNIDRLKRGSTLHYGVRPGEKRRRSWWLEPGYTAVPSSVVDEVRALARPKLELELI